MKSAYVVCSQIGILISVIFTNCWMLNYAWSHFTDQVNESVYLNSMTLTAEGILLIEDSLVPNVYDIRDVPRVILCGKDSAKRPIESVGAVIYGPNANPWGFAFGGVNGIDLRTITFVEGERVHCE